MGKEEYSFSMRAGLWKPVSFCLEIAVLLLCIKTSDKNRLSPTHVQKKLLSLFPLKSCNLLPSSALPHCEQLYFVKFLMLLCEAGKKKKKRPKILCHLLNVLRNKPQLVFVLIRLFPLLALFLTLPEERSKHFHLLLLALNKT